MGGFSKRGRGNSDILTQRGCAIILIWVTFSGLLFFGSLFLIDFCTSGVHFANDYICSAVVHFLLERCFIISVEVSSDHFKLKCMGFAGSH